jgi:hypothetical protein
LELSIGVFKPLLLDTDLLILENCHTTDESRINFREDLVFDSICPTQEVETHHHPICDSKSSFKDVVLLFKSNGGSSKIVQDAADYVQAHEDKRVLFEEAKERHEKKHAKSMGLPQAESTVSSFVVSSYIVESIL